jgi:DNA-directed RNA polymerase specialized sigma24 family protein
MAGLSRIVARSVSNPDDAADIVQQTALLACAASSVAPISNLPHWLLTVAHHQIVDYYKAQNRFRFAGLASRLVDIEPALQSRPDLALAIVESRQSLGLLLARIGRLSWLEHQVALLLSDLHGHSDRHSAAQMRMSLPCFKLLLHRARGCLDAISGTARCLACPMLSVCSLPRLGVTCGLAPPQLFTVRAKLLQGLTQ